MSTDILAAARQIAVAAPDNVGRLVGKRVPARRWAEVAAGGLAMPNYHLVTGIENVPATDIPATGYHTGFRNGLLMPRPETAFRTALEPHTAIVLADVLDAEGRPVAEAPGAILARQIERLAAHGLRATVATELEFYLFRTGYAEAHARDYRDLEAFYHFHGDNDVLISGFAEDFCERLRGLMEEAGMVDETSQGEGGPGQIEINLAPADPEGAARQHAIFKHLTKDLARREGLAASFMAKLDPHQAGSSGHVHIRVTDEAGNGVLGAAAGEESPDGLGARGRAFLAGLVRHARDFQLLHMPYHNSYKRLRPASFAPTNASWGGDNRTVMVRTVNRGPAMRFEFRLPGADMNPWFSIAGILAAGLAGLEAGAAAPPPVEASAYDADPDVASPLARTLGDAIGAFEASEVAAAGLGPAVRDHLARLARLEWAEELAVVTPWEIRRGFERA
ncbi:MAG: glutamine synthetase family protein [Azospirillaceae bacterium]